MPMKPAPTTTARSARAAASRMAFEFPTVRSVKTFSSSEPGTSRRRGHAPLASRSFRYPMRSASSSTARSRTSTEDTAVSSMTSTPWSR